METCKHGLGAGIRKPTAEMRQGAGCRAYRECSPSEKNKIVWFVIFKTVENLFLD